MKNFLAAPLIAVCFVGVFSFLSYENLPRAILHAAYAGCAVAGIARLYFLDKGVPVSWLDILAGAAAAGWIAAFISWDQHRGYPEWAVAFGWLFTPPLAWFTPLLFAPLPIFGGVFTLGIALILSGQLPRPRGFAGSGRRTEAAPVQGEGFDPRLYDRDGYGGGGPYGGYGHGPERIRHDQRRIPQDTPPQGYSTEDAKRFFAMSGLDGPGSNTAKATELARRLKIALGPDKGADFLSAAARDSRLPKNMQAFYKHAEQLVTRGQV